MTTPILQLKGLKVYFRQATSKGRQCEFVRAVDGVNIEINPGEIVCLLGESGSGKSTVGLSLLGLYQGQPGIVGGKIIFRNKELLKGIEAFCYKDGKSVARDERRWDQIFRNRTRQLRGHEIGIIFQEVRSSVTPFLRIGKQLHEILQHNRHYSYPKSTLRNLAIQWLERLGVPSPNHVMRSYPFELSGGICQLITIALALAACPVLLVADEPTDSLDIVIQNRILSLFDQYRRDNQKPGILFITHHVELAARLGDRIAIMYAGRVIEAGPKSRFWGVSSSFDQHHPYTSILLTSAREESDVVAKYPEFFLGPSINARKFPSGCPFHPRCPFRFDLPDKGKRCEQEEPPDFDLGEGHQARCWKFDGEYSRLDSQIYPERPLC